MRCVLTAALALSALALTPRISEASGGCCPPCITYETRVVTCYRPVWREEKVDCLVPKVTWEEEVNKVKCVRMVPKWDEETRTVSCYKPVWRDEDRDVVRCVMKPVTIVDPCTGCSWTTCRPEYVKERVRVRVCDYQLDKRDVEVAVCRWEREETFVEQRCLKPRTTYEKAVVVRRVCDYEAVPVTICVPVYCGSR